ncbi:MAG: hypothetical protein ACKOPH_11635 [Methylocystis sp.]|nr:hypothetical protein [Alphaproteobacteria bacterium]
MRKVNGLLYCCASVLLAACNATPPAPVAPTLTSAAASNLPSGSSCAAAITKYRAVMENDLSMGHVNKTVYAQIMGEISQAETACGAGEDVRAVSLVRASKSRHGYPG